MKRYFVVNEYFGLRVYDSKEKKEYYFDSKDSKKIKDLLCGEYNEIDNKKENQFSAPLKISMNLTKRCNLRCKQCFSDSGEIKAQELTTKEMFKLFDDMNKYGTFFICLGGGEPLTRPDLLEILEYGEKKQLAISIVSNGLLLTRELIEKLNKVELDTFWVSLDGLEENHEMLRGKTTFKKALASLQLLKNYYKGKTAIRISLNKYNVGEYKELIKIAEEYNIDLIRFTPIISFGRAKNENLTIDQEQYIEFLKNIKKVKSKVEIVYPTKPTPQKIWIGTNGFGCHCGKEAIWIDEIGNYSPCIFWGDKYILGNIKEKSYMELWNDSLISANITGNKTCENCKNYKVCRGGCRVRALYEFGNLNDVDPLCPLRKNRK